MIPIPNLKDLGIAYETLKTYKKCNIDELILYSEWSRFDPRLGEILVGVLKSQWQNLNPLIINEKLKHSWCPQVMGVVLEHVLLIVPKMQIEKFKKWKTLVMDSVEPVPYQSFSMGVWGFASKRIVEESRFPLLPFERWGFYSTDLLLSKAQRDRVSMPLSKKLWRELKLRDLIRNFPRIKVEDYLSAVFYSVSKRQAERDLASCTFLKSKGNTQAKFYFKP